MRWVGLVGSEECDKTGRRHDGSSMAAGRPATSVARIGVASLLAKALVAVLIARCGLVAGGGWDWPPISPVRLSVCHSDVGNPSISGDYALTSLQCTARWQQQVSGSVRSVCAVHLAETDGSWSHGHGRRGCTPCL